MFYFYLFQCKDKSLYSGITNDIQKREQAHNSGKGSKYVRAHGGGRVVYTEKFRTIGKALKREAEVKKFSRGQKLDLITMKFESTDQYFDNGYPKLVRDKIPEIVFAKTGEKLVQRILKNNKEYLKYLFKKVVEEAKELEYSLKHGNTQEELADLYEVLDAILKVKGWKKSGIVKIQTAKLKKNGGFEKRILMLEK